MTESALVQADSAMTENNIDLSDPEVVLSNKLADYAKTDWINTTADIYAQSEGHIESNHPVEQDMLTEEQALALKMAESLTTQGEELKQAPLPSEDDIETMLSEIRQLEQQEMQAESAYSDKHSQKDTDPLKQVLSTIPAFSETNK